MTADHIYTHGHHEAVLRSHRRRTVANSAAYIAPRFTPGARVLDVGCGPGTITAEIASLVAPGGDAIGIDAAATVINAAAADHIAPNLAFRAADVYDFSEFAGQFDVVHAHQVLQHLHDPVAALGQMRAACKPGGVVAARDSDYGAFTWWPGSDGLTRWLEIYSAVARRNGGEPDAGRRLLSWARAAGFTEIEPSASVWCYATPHERSWWAETWAERITASPLAERAIEIGAASADDLAACGDAWLHWAEQPDAWFAVLHGEIIAA